MTQPRTPNKGNPTPGLDCPNCGQRVPLSIQTLLTAEAIRCPGCGLELTMDREASNPAIQALQEYQDALQKAEAMKK